jgi:hypothetical protein
MRKIDIRLGIAISGFAVFLYFLEALMNYIFGFAAQGGSGKETHYFFESIKFIKIFTALLIITAPLSGVVNEFDFKKVKINWIMLVIITTAASMWFYFV